MREVLDAEPLLSGGVTARWDERPVTRFERKGLAAGRGITDLAYTRREDGGQSSAEVDPRALELELDAQPL